MKHKVNQVNHILRDTYVWNFKPSLTMEKKSTKSIMFWDIHIFKYSIILSLRIPKSTKSDYEKQSQPRFETYTYSKSQPFSDYETQSQPSQPSQPGFETCIWKYTEENLKSTKSATLFLEHIIGITIQ